MVQEHHDSRSYSPSGLADNHDLSSPPSKMLLFLLLVPLLAAQHWSWPPIHLNFTGLVSPECQKDTQKWMESLVRFPFEFEKCFRDGNATLTCGKEDEKRMIEDFYGVKQLDSFGNIPPGMLDIKTVAYGDLQECQEVSKHFYYPTKYCFIHTKISKEYKCDSEPKVPFKIAVCMPKSCTSEDIVTVFNGIEAFKNGSFSACSATCKKDAGETDTFTWIFLAFMCVIVSLVLVSSTIDYILEYRKRSKEVQSTALNALLSFSLYTNGHQILDTTPPREGHLKSLDFIRFISMIWVAAGHLFNFNVANDAVIPLLHIPRPILSDTLMSAFFSVDTFFVVSGLLVAYMFFKAAAKTPKMVKKPLTWVLFYVHRYLRLIPPYMLFICFIIVVIPLMTGVYMTEWDADGTLVEPCRRHWWKNLLLINNFDLDPPCYGITWYLACDMQIFLSAPLFLLAFYLSPWLGFGAIAAACLGSSIATIVLTVHYNLPATGARPEKAAEFNDYIYMKPWIRCPPYLIGMAAGYLLAKFGNKRPKVHWLLPLVGWCLNIAMALAIIYGPHDYLALETNWARGIRGFYDAGSRVGWAIFVVWVIMANHFGYGGPIATLMDHPFWQPFGRLSYCAYLSHMFLIYYLVNLQDRPLHYNGVWAQFIQQTIPVVVMAYFFAFFWSCLTEMPFLKLEKILFDTVIPQRRPDRMMASEKEKRTDQWVDE